MKDRKVKTGPIWGLIPVGGGRCKERVNEGEYSGNILMYENGTRPVESTLRMGGGDKGE
jgi:hypothetical protein